MADVVPLSDSVIAHIQEGYLTCPIHQGYFIQPKALPCLHTFCLSCLLDYVRSRGLEASGTFPCPICRDEVNMAPGGVDGFPDNHMIVSLLDKLDCKDEDQPETVYVAPVVSDNRTVSDNRGPVSGQSEVTAPSNIGLSEDPRQPTQQISDPTNTDQRTLSIQSTLGQTSMQVPMENALVQIHRNCPSGAFLSFGQYGHGLVDFTSPVGLASYRGHIIVSDQNHNRLLLFTLEGKITKLFTCPGQVSDLDVTSQGHILVAFSNSKEALAVCYTMGGQKVKSYGGGISAYENAFSVATAPYGRIITSCPERNLVYILGENGKVIQEFGSEDGRRLKKPTYLTVRNSDIIVCNSGYNNIKVLDIKTGVTKVQFGDYGNQDGQLDNPGGICVDHQGNVIIADSGNFRVQVYSESGVYLSTVVTMDTYSIAHGQAPVNVAMVDTDILAVLVKGPLTSEIQLFHYRSPTSPTRSKLCRIM